MDFFNLFKPQGLTPFKIGGDSNAIKEEKKRKEEEKKRKEEEQRKRILESMVAKQTPVATPKPLDLGPTPVAAESARIKPDATFNPISSLVNTMKANRAKSAQLSGQIGEKFLYPQREPVAFEKGFEKIVRPIERGIGIVDEVARIATKNHPRVKEIVEPPIIAAKLLSSFAFGDPEERAKTQKIRQSGTTEERKALVSKEQRDQFLTTALMMSVGPIETRFEIDPKIARGILKVKEGATESEILKAYRKVSKEKFSKSAEDLAKKHNRNINKFINNAKDVLIKEVRSRTTEPTAIGNLFKSGEQKVGSSILTPEEVAAKYPKEKFGIKLKESEIKAIIKAKPSNPETIQKAVQYMDKLTTEHDTSVSVPTLNYVQKMIGDAKLNKLVDTYLGQNLFKSPTNVKDFWEQVNKELATKEKPSIAYYRQQERDYIDYLATQEPPIESQRIPSEPESIAPVEVVKPPLVAEGKVVKEITGYRTEGGIEEGVRPESGAESIVQRSAGTYISLDEPYIKQGGVVKKVKIKIDPKKIFDPNGLMEGTNNKLAKKQFQSYIDELNRRLPSLEETQDFVKMMKDMAELKTTVLKEMGYEGEVGNINGGGNTSENARELVVFDRNLISIGRESKPPEVSAPVEVVKPPEVSTKDAIKEVLSFPEKKTVTPETVEPIVKEYRAHGDSIVDRIAQGIDDIKITEDDFIKFIEDPKSAPPEVKELIDTHKQLIETFHTSRENQSLGELPQYFPHMRNETINLPPELQNMGRDLWISKFNLDLGTSKQRTGTLTDFSTNYKKVMKNYVEQSAYDKYGSRLNQTEETVEFVDKLEEHLKPIDKEGTLAPPNTKFDYIAESAKRQKIENPEVIRAKIQPIQGFDELRRMIEKEPNGKKLSDTMRAIRDMEDNMAGLLIKVEKLTNAEKLNLIDSQLRNLSEGQRNTLKTLSQSEKGIPDSLLRNLINYEKKMRIQNFIDEIGKYDFEKATHDFLNDEADRIVKTDKYVQSILDKFVNFITGVFYRAQIWGNLKVALSQKIEIIRKPFLYTSEYIKAGVKQHLKDLKTGRDILKDYDLAGVEVDVSKQLGAKSKERSLGKFKKLVVESLKKVDKGAGKVGNFPIIAAENSKNRDFAYSAEAEGKSLGKEGRELYDHVRDAVISDGLILQRYNTPKILKNWWARLLFQYQQYQFKTFNKITELYSKGEKGKAAGLVGAHVFSLVLVALLTGKGWEGVKSAVENLKQPPSGPAISIIAQLYGITMDYKEAEESGNEVQKKVAVQKATKTAVRNTAPFSNQFFKATDFVGVPEPFRDFFSEQLGTKGVMQEGGDLTASGRVKGLPPENFVSKLQGALFGKKYKPYEAETALGENQSKLFKELPTNEEKKDYYNRVIEDRKVEKEKEKEKEKVIEGIINQMKTTSTVEERVEILSKYKQSLGDDEEFKKVYKKVVAEWSDYNTGITEAEKGLRNESVENRVKWIKDRLAKMDKADHKSYLQDFYKKKIITQAVWDELKKSGYSLPE